LPRTSARSLISRQLPLPPVVILPVREDALDGAVRAAISKRMLVTTRGRLGFLTQPNVLL
jgi:hypothetical protein